MTHLEMFLQVMINVSLPIRSNSLQTSLWKMQCSETPAPGTPTHLTTQPAFIILLLFFVMCLRFLEGDGPTPSKALCINI